MLYALQAEGLLYVKFGLTGKESIKSRLSTLQVGCPLKLHVLTSADWPDFMESHIHLRLREHHVRGEWFHMVPDVLDVIEHIRSGERGLAALLGQSGATAVDSKHRLRRVLDYSYSLLDLSMTRSTKAPKKAKKP